MRQGNRKHTTGRFSLTCPILIALLLCLAATGVSVAYLSYGKRIVNEFNIGTNTISIEEDFRPPKEQIVGDNTFKKKVQIKNTDKTECFVRAYLEFSDVSIKDLAMISPDGKSWYDPDSYTESRSHSLPAPWVYVHKSQDPLLGGYYYYTKPLSENEKTVPLIDSIKVTYENQGQIEDFEIIVVADSVQTYINEVQEDGSQTAKNAADDTDGWKKVWEQFLENR